MDSLLILIWFRLKRQNLDACKHALHTIKLRHKIYLELEVNQSSP
jgi:hypothetical protein